MLGQAGVRSLEGLGIVCTPLQLQPFTVHLQALQCPSAATGLRLQGLVKTRPSALVLQHLLQLRLLALQPFGSLSLGFALRQTLALPLALGQQLPVL